MKVNRLLLVLTAHSSFNDENPKLIICMLKKNHHKLQVLLELIQTSTGAVVIT